jgi:hypothetical protein
MRKSLIALAVTLSVLTVPITSAGAAESTSVATVTANVTAGNIGVRSITSTPAVVLSSAPNVETSNGSMSAIVTEGAVTGANPWTLTAALSTLTLTSGPETLANSNVAVSNRSTTAVAGGGSISSPSGSQNLSATRTLVTNTQGTTTVYTGVYTTSADLALTVPNLSKTGVYTGTLTITLIQ